MSPWPRPPIRNIICVYGTDMPTPVGYKFAPGKGGVREAGDWDIRERWVEERGRIYNEITGEERAG